MNAGVTDSDAATGKWVLGLVAVIAIAAGIYLWTQEETESGSAAPVTDEPAQPAQAEAADAVEHPVETPEAEPLPPLAESDAAVATSLADLFPGDQFSRLFVDEDLVRRITVTVDNLTREKVAMRLRPVEPMPDAFIAVGPEEGPMLDESNYARYRPYVDVVEAIDAAQAAAVYRRLYPLFQEAYEELGNPSAYFNDRVIDVIDHLLATPDPGNAIEVVLPPQDPSIEVARPWVLYQYADPALQSLSAGQKILVRMGSDNASRMKGLLRELRKRLATEPRPGASPATARP